MSYIPGPTKQATASGTITTIGASVQLACDGYSSYSVVFTGTWTGTISTEISADGGTTWVSSDFHEVCVNCSITNGTALSRRTINTNGTYRITDIAANTHIRVKATSVVTGTVNVLLIASDSPDNFQIIQAAIIQNIVLDTGNSSTANINGGATFTGTLASTYGVNAIQTIFFADRACTIYIDQGQDATGVNWDVTDSFTVLANTGDSRVIASVAPYYRIRVTNNAGSPTTVLRLSTGQTPIINPLPRTTSQNGNLMVANRENMPDKITTGNIVTDGETVVSAVGGYKSAGIVITGTWTGTLVWDISSDNQATWSTSSLRGGSIAGAGGGAAFPQTYSSITANGTYKPNSTGGVTHMRIRATTAITGTVYVSIVHTDAKHLFSFTSSQIVQNVIASEYNNSTANLAGAATFTGTGETTLGVAGIQVNFFADQICRIQVQQSMDNLTGHWDISDEFANVPNVGIGRTFQATASYFRIIVTNATGITTTVLRLQTALCPIVEALPRTLTNDGNLKVAIEASTVITRDYLINTQFFGSYLDEYNWYKTSSLGGAVTPSNTYVELLTGTNAAATTYLYSKTKITPSILPRIGFETTLSFNQPTLASNTRRWGLIAGTSGETDGACFELKDGVLYSTVIANSSATRISVDGFKPTDALSHKYILEVSGSEIKWKIDNTIVYSLSGSSIPEFYNRNFSSHISNVNTGTTTTSYLRVTATTFYDSINSGVHIKNGDGNNADVSIDGFLRTKNYGSVLFADLFKDNTLDTTNKWTEAIVAGGSKSLSGTILSLTVTTANGASITENAKQSIISATGQSMLRILIVANLGSTFDNNNQREWGGKTGTNGFFFRQQGSNTYAVAVNNGSEQTLLLLPQTDGRTHTYEIIRTGLTDVWFYIDRERVGAMHGVTSFLVSSKYSTPWLANRNTAGAAAGLTLQVMACAVIEDASQSMGVIGQDQNGLIRQVVTDQFGSLRVTGGASTPSTPSASETSLLRTYQTTYEYTLAASNTEYPVIYFRNPNGSGKVMYIKNVSFTCGTVSRSVTMRIYQNPTATGNGTTLTPTSMYVGGSAAAATGLTTYVPTITSNGTKITAASASSEQITIDYNWGLLVAANNSILITGQGSANTVVIIVNIIWSETTA
jgi:hypothetical protein